MKQETLVLNEQIRDEIIEKRRAERKDRKRARRKTIKRHCCRQCGEPKHYICLEHNHNRKASFLKRIVRKSRRYGRKIYFMLAAKLDFTK